MIRATLLRALRRASCHIAGETRYRFYPVYACVLVLAVILSCKWPYNPQWFEIVMSHRWILSLDVDSCDLALKMALMLGLVGLFRPGVVAKGLSAWAVWESLHIMSSPFLYFLAFLWDRALWYGFDIPTAFINGLADGNASMATMLWFGYLVILWLLVRPVALLGFRRIQRLGRYAFDRWPQLRVLDRKVI